MRIVLIIVFCIILILFPITKAHGASMTKVYKRILKCKKASGLSWDEIAKQAGIPLASWMTGIPTSSPSDTDLEKIAPVLNTTYNYLKYGIEE